MEITEMSFVREREEERGRVGKAAVRRRFE
jgi:hypothetical protein